jgi:hypothetical protein
MTRRESHLAISLVIVSGLALNLLATLALVLVTVL